MRQPASAINPAPSPSNAPAMAGLVGYARDTRTLASATTGNAVATDPARQIAPTASHCARRATGLSCQLASVIARVIAIGTPIHNAIATPFHDRPGTDSRSAAVITAKPSDSCAADAPQASHQAALHPDAH